MTDVDGVISIELVEALKVLMGENKRKKKSGNDDSDDDSNSTNISRSQSSSSSSSNPLTMQIIDVFDSRAKDSKAQTDMLLEAIKKQNELLTNIVSVLLVTEQQQQQQGIMQQQQRRNQQPKPTGVNMNENDSLLTQQQQSEDEVVAAIAVAEAATNERRQEIAVSKKEIEDAVDTPYTSTPSPKLVTEKEVVDVPQSAPSLPPTTSLSPVVANQKQQQRRSTVININNNKPWTFVESDVAIKRRNRLEKSSGSGSNDNDDDILKTEDALFGKVNTRNPASESDEIQGDSFGKHWDRMSTRVDRNGKLKAPKWSTLGSSSSRTSTSSGKQVNDNIRSYLPKLAIGGETKIKLNSGVYYLTMKYENGYLNKKATPTNNGHSMKKIEAAIIIGEIAFDSKGFVVANSADIDKLFIGSKRQLMNPPSSTTKPNKIKWYSSKVSDPWQNGDTIRFKINTVTNTLGYTIQGMNEKEVRSGWMFQNILAFTNNHTYPDYFQVFAYCGGTSLNSNSNSPSSSSKSIENSSASSSSSFENVKLNIVETSIFKK